MTRRRSQGDGPGEEAKHPQGRADTSGAPEPAVLRHVVAIGASAGGLEALQAFVGALEAGGTTAYVVAQHLAPEHRSLIVDLLARATRLPVVAASDGRRLTPDAIVVAPPRHDVILEHDLLRPRFGDPRLHFALVCAAVGCPLLRPEAYRAERLEAQLEEDARRFLQHPQKLRFEPASGRLRVSRIFEWYRGDVLAVAPSIPAYVGRYRPELALPADVRLHYLPYDWALNGRDSVVDVAVEPLQLRGRHPQAPEQADHQVDPGGLP